MGKNRRKLFFENILIYGLGSAMNMIIPFIMLPIISRLLPSSEYYGINDTVIIIISFGSSVAMLGMYDAMYRFYFDKDDLVYHKKVCSSTLSIVGLSGFIVMTIIIILRNQLSNLIFSDYTYSSLIIICGFNIFLNVCNTILAAPTRIRNQRLRYIIIQTVAPIISYTVAVFFIIEGEFIF